MSDDVAQVRSFHRTVTQRIGALSEHYLDRGRPLGASRVLWEIGPGGAEVKGLRDRLELDSGYLSRLLRQLEAERLVAVEPDPSDRRGRVVHLTDAGRAERVELDRRSDALADSLLSPLSPDKRARLVAAMSTVEQLLTAGLVSIAPEDPTSPAARSCLRAYFTELNSRFPTGFDPERSLAATATELVAPSGVLMLAWLRGDPIGCGAVKLHGQRPAELKRMWVAASARGLGVGRRILNTLEQYAQEHGAPAVHLETNENLHEAIALYRASGYREVPAFNDEPYAHHWFEKRFP